MKQKDKIEEKNNRKNSTKMSVNKWKRLLKDKFKYNKIEFIDKTTAIIYATTGKVTSSKTITYLSTIMVKDLDNFLSLEQSMLHTEIERCIFKIRYEEINPHPFCSFNVNTNNIIVDRCAPPEKIYIVCHPEMYMKLLKKAN